MNTEQKDVYTTAKNMGVTQPYACGWFNHHDCGFGWQVVRMKDNAVLYQGNVTQTEIKARLFDMGISKNEIVFI